MINILPVRLAAVRVVMDRFVTPSAQRFPLAQLVFGNLDRRAVRVSLGGAIAPGGDFGIRPALGSGAPNIVMMLGSGFADTQARANTVELT